MKFIKIIFTLLLFLFLIPNLKAERIKITKKNGGCNGYDKITENHDMTNNNHTLDCSDPGNVQCVWDYPPVVTTQTGFIVHPGEIQDYIIGQIQSGVPSGTVQWGTSGEVIAVWTNGVVTCNGYNFELTIYVNESPFGN